MRSLTLQGYSIVLWISLGMLALSLALWAHQRGKMARARAERARREAERPELGGDSYFLPPAPIEQAVELANPVEIESLLAGESETVAAAARRQLEATTDIGITEGLRDLTFALPASTSRPSASAPVRPVPPPQANAPAASSTPSPRTGYAARKPTSSVQATRPVPARPPDRLAAATGSPPPAAHAASQPAASAPENQFRIPVRELVLAWFEARGYRATTPFRDAHPIELVLHHRKDRDRSYAFVVERGLVTSKRVSSLLAHARASGLSRLLIAAEAGTEADLAKRVQREGIRVFDEAGIRGQLGKIDIRVAAKIIAVARSRGLARRTAAASAAARARQPTGPGGPLAAAKF
ncbi:MAG TPA: hypothetical protein VED47_07725 [Burkholderiaceae bacterium]|nr:hypothetical protein [Burkholderiaceae bacterium]